MAKLWTSYGRHANSANSLCAPADVAAFLSGLHDKSPWGLGWRNPRLDHFSIARGSRWYESKLGTAGTTSVASFCLQQIENVAKLATVPVFLPPNSQQTGENWQHLCRLVASFRVFPVDRRGLSVEPAVTQAAATADTSGRTGSRISGNGRLYARRPPTRSGGFLIATLRLQVNEFVMYKVEQPDRAGVRIGIRKPSRSAKVSAA